MSEFLAQLYAATLPPLLLILSTILGRIIARAALVAHKRWGIEIEARHREALQSAMMTGITAALARGLKADAAISAAIQHATGAGARDAVEFFDLGMDELKKLAESKLHSAFPFVGIDLASDEARNPDSGRKAAFDLGRAVGELKVNPASPHSFGQVTR